VVRVEIFLSKGQSQLIDSSVRESDDEEKTLHMIFRVCNSVETVIGSGHKSVRVSNLQNQTVSSVEEYSPHSNDVTAEVEESTLLQAVTTKRLVKAN
jgi:hypothetical protein